MCVYPPCPLFVLTKEGLRLYMYAFYTIVGPSDPLSVWCELSDVTYGIRIHMRYVVDLGLKGGG